jgi:hypothetical protein
MFQEVIDRLENIYGYDMDAWFEEEKEAPKILQDIISATTEMLVLMN